MIEVAIESRPLHYSGRDACVAVALRHDRPQSRGAAHLHLARHDALTDLPNRAALDQHFATARRARASATARASRCSASISTASRRSTTCSATPWATRAARGLAPRCRPPRTARSSPASAATSSSPSSRRGRCRQPPSCSRAGCSRALDQDIEVDGHAFELGLSIGIALYPRDGNDARTLLANADAALYRAKHEGRGAIRFFTPRWTSSRATAARSSAICGRRSPTASSSLEYQPQVSTATARSSASRRWRAGIIRCAARAARRLHPDRRGERPDRRDRRMGAARSLSRGRVLAARRCRSPSTSRRCSSAAATCSRLVQTVLQETGLAPDAARARDHRRRADRERRARHRDAEAPQGARRAHRAGRFRHRLFVAVAICSPSRSTGSRSIAPSSPSSGATTARWRSCAPSSASRTGSACRRSPRASRPTSSARPCCARAATRCRAT